jgi:hypothetical protein
MSVMPSTFTSSSIPRPAAAEQPTGFGRLFGTAAWAGAWERATVEVAAERCRVPVEPGGPVEPLTGVPGAAIAVPLTKVRHSPLWTGYEQDAGVSAVWSAPVGYLSSVYAVSGALDRLSPPRAVGVLRRAARQAQEWGCQALVVSNLEAGPVLDSVLAAEPPDALLRLDATCRLSLPESFDAYTAALNRDVRAELRRRWRRATERGVTCAEYTGAQATAALPGFLAVTTASAARHGTPPLYDLWTLQALLDLPGSRLYIAERKGELLAGLLGLEWDGCLTLWAGGIEYSALREFSPYVFLLHELVRRALGAGWRGIDFGRGNFAFKARHGFTPVDLLSPVYVVDGAVRPALTQRLAAMSAGLDAFLEPQLGKLRGGRS